MTSYHRRVYVYPQDAYSLAIVKLGSGSNLLGYYMYHGGTNPEGHAYLNEMQRTPYTNWNDLPVKNNPQTRSPPPRPQDSGRRRGRLPRTGAAAAG